MDQQKAFSYTYSAPENQEILNIRRMYLPREETKIEELKRLDHLVQSSGVTGSLCAGIIGCTVFNLGMCLSMEVIGQLPWLGILLGTAGALMMLSAFPMYRRFLSKAKAKYAPRILQLAAELSGEV